MRNGFVTIGGMTYHYQNGLLHREDGPAVEYPSGSVLWCQNGLRHRLDGPAYESFDGYKIWIFHDKEIDCKSQEEFEEQIKLAPFW
jgi:hypothetical protein